MAKVIHSQRPYHWCTSSLLAIITLFICTPQVHAEDLFSSGNFDKAITFNNTSPGVITIKVALCCYYDGGKIKTLYNSNDNVNIRIKYKPDGKDYGEYYFLSAWVDDGGGMHGNYIYHLNDNNKSHGESLFFLNKNGTLTLIGNKPVRESQSMNETTFVEFEWHYPTQMIGKEVEFIFDGTIWCADTQSNIWYENYRTTINKFTIGDEITLDAYEPVPCTEAGDEGKMMIPVVSSNTINSLKMYDKVGQQLVDTVPVQPGNSMMIKVDATEPYDSLKYEPNILLSTVYNAPVNSSTTVSGPFTKVIPDSLPMIHKPENLCHTVQNDTIKLTWQVHNLKYSDLLPGDMFQIQRKLLNATDYESDMFLLVRLQDELAASSSDDDCMAVFINGECRGLTEVRNTADDGGCYFLLKIHGNNADLRAPLTLSYYSAQLKQLFTLPAIDAFVPERTRGFDKDFVPALLDGCAKYPVHCQLTVTLQPSASFTVAPDDLVAAFVGDECRGVGQVGTPFTVFAHDDNEVLQLRYYSATKGGIYTFARTITAAQQQLSYPMNL